MELTTMETVPRIITGRKILGISAILLPFDRRGEVDHLNDILQYLGFFAFRNPVPAYKHSAAQWLHVRKWIASNKTHPNSPDRPSTDIAILSTLLEQLSPFIKALVSWTAPL
jgi:hypothetical protein